MRTAMILAAGLGTRLRPLTDTMPKAMVPYHGTPMIEILLCKLQDAGFQRVIINLHHFGKLLRDFVLSLGIRDMEILFSDESELLLDTGGAIKHATHLLEGKGPILIHNVDIISNVDLEQLYNESCIKMQTGADIGAILITNCRETGRYLLFDGENHLQGWMNTQKKLFRTIGKDCDNFQDLSQIRIPSEWSKQAFGGIHIISPDTLPLMKPFPASFSIIDFYLSIADKKSIIACTPENMSISDIGKIDSLK